MPGFRPGIARTHVPCQLHWALRVCIYSPRLDSWSVSTWLHIEWRLPCWSALRRVQAQELLRAGTVSSWVVPFIMGVSSSLPPPHQVSNPQSWSPGGANHGTVAQPWVCAGRKELEASLLRVPSGVGSRRPVQLRRGVGPASV